jgi:hypothetical protein
MVITDRPQIHTCHPDTCGDSPDHSRSRSRHGHSISRYSSWGTSTRTHSSTSHSEPTTALTMRGSWVSGARWRRVASRDRAALGGGDLEGARHRACCSGSRSTRGSRAPAECRPGTVGARASRRRTANRTPTTANTATTADVFSRHQGEISAQPRAGFRARERKPLIWLHSDTHTRDTAALAPDHEERRGPRETRARAESTR